MLQVLGEGDIDLEAGQRPRKKTVFKFYEVPTSQPNTVFVPICGCECGAAVTMLTQLATLHLQEYF